MLLVIHKHNLGQGTSNQQDRPGMGTLDLTFRSVALLTRFIVYVVFYLKIHSK